MRIIIFTFLSILLLTSCKKDPNKNISEGKIEKGIYHNEEIGWTIKVPDGWDVIKQDIQQGLDAINETAGVEYISIYYRTF